MLITRKNVLNSVLEIIFLRILKRTCVLPNLHFERTCSNISRTLIGILHFSNKRRDTRGVYLKVGRAKNCFDFDIAICCIKLTELTSFDFHYNGAVAPRAMALGGSYSRAALI